MVKMVGGSYFFKNVYFMRPKKDKTIITVVPILPSYVI